MLDLTGRWALVTGASRGIGKQMAVTLAEQGVNVIVHSRDIAHTENLLAEIHGLGVESFAVQAELSDTAQVLAMADEILEKVSLDLLFNDAGIQPKPRDAGRYWEADAQQYAQTYAVNVIAPMLLIEKFLPGMLERGFGRVVNTTSGIADQPEQGAYAASKGGLNKVTKDFSSKFSVASATDDTAGVADITMNVADPGWIRTDLGGSAAPNAVESVVPGMVVAAFAEQRRGINGKWVNAQDFAGMGIEEAVAALPGKVLELAVTK